MLYVLAILKGKGLKDYDIIKSFREMIWRKMKITTEEKQSLEWPYSPQEIVEMLGKGPLREIYNTVFDIVHGKSVTTTMDIQKQMSTC